MIKNIFITLLAILSLGTVALAQGIAPTAEKLIANQVGFFALYNSDGNGNRTENAIGGGYVAVYSPNIGKVSVTFTNFGSIEESSVTPVGGRQLTSDTSVLVPLDLKLPFGGESSNVYLVGNTRLLWQSGDGTNGSKFIASPGFGVGFKIPSAIGDSYTEYIYVPSINAANSNMQEHRVAYSLYRPLNDNPKYRFFSRVTASTGRFDPIPVPLNFTGAGTPYYNVKIAVGITRTY